MPLSGNTVQDWRFPGANHFRSRRRNISNCILRLAVPLQIALFAVVIPELGAAEETASQLAPRGMIIDVDKQPIPGAQITLHRWDGVMSPALETAKTDAGGRFKFPTRPADAYYYVIARKPPYAPLTQIAGSDDPVTITLRPAVRGWIEVQNSQGESLIGARVANISIRTPENKQAYIWRGMEHLFGFEFGPSDEAGRLELPPLPEGALVNVFIYHPRWAQAKVENLTAAAERLATVKMAPGVTTIFEFVADSRTPITLDGMTIETLLLAQRSHSAATLNLLPMTINGGRIEFRAHPTTYTLARLKAPGFSVTPVFNRLKIVPAAEHRFRFLIRKTVDFTGRVVRSDGTPHKGAWVYSQTENRSPEGLSPDTEEWANCSGVETDAEGKFTVALPPGRGRVYVSAEGFVPDRDYEELDVTVDSPRYVPDFLVEKLEPIGGRVVDESGRPVAGAIVRFRYPSVNWMQPVVSDAEGKFKIALTRIPNVAGGRERHFDLPLVAFVADRPLAGVTQINLRKRDSLDNVRVVLRPESSTDGLLAMDDVQWRLAKRREAIAERPEGQPAGRRGQPAPELDGAAWFNTDFRSLKELRGRYVLLDFWFTGCGPCHGDFPSVKLVHEQYKKHGVTVIAVHDNSSSPEAVREHCAKEELTFPIVVDHPDGRILNSYRKLGVRGFPTYLLIDPEGKIMEIDRVTDGPPLRTFKLEMIRKYVLGGKQ